MQNSIKYQNNSKLRQGVMSLFVLADKIHTKLNKSYIAKDRKLKSPKGTEAIYPIDKIYVPRRIANSTPSADKYKRYEEYFTLNGTIDRPITVFQDKYDESKVILYDGYIRYLILANQNVKNIPVKFTK